MNFKPLIGGDEQVYVSKKLSNGDFDYWLVISAGQLPDPPNDHYCMLQAVAPSELSEEIKLQALEQYDLETWPADEMFVVEIIHSYMGGALIWQDTGANLAALMKEAHKQADFMGSMLFGFAMDKVQNGLGATGWDVLKGNVWGKLRRED